MKRYSFRAVIAGMAGIFLLLSLASCGRAGYQYNNLISEEDMTEFSEIMASAGIPDQDAEAVLEYVSIYSGGAFSKKALVKGWQKTTKSYQEIYDYTDAINQYTQQEFEDINCRQAAFMLYHSFFQAQETEGPGERQEVRKLFEEDEGVLFFEKTDPILPFQLSRFASVDEMKEYLLGREGVSEQHAVFVDDSSV